MSHLNSLPLDNMAAILADDIFKCIFINENDKISIPYSLKCVPGSPIDDNRALVQIMAWSRTATSHYLNQYWPSSLTLICGTRGRSFISYGFISFSVTITTQWLQYIAISQKPFNLRFQSEWNALPHQANTSSFNYLVTAHILFTRRPHCRSSCQANSAA